MPESSMGFALKMDRNIRRPRSGITQAKLLGAAAELFAQKGYRATTLDDVAERIGIKKASLYHYVASKEQLLVEIYQNLYVVFEGRIRPIAELDLPADERLRRMIYTYVELITSHVDMMAMVLRDEAELSEPNRKLILRRHRQMEWVFENVLEEGQRVGVIRPMTGRLMELAMFGMVLFIQYWYRNAGYAPERIAAEFIMLLERGWLADGSDRTQALPRADSVSEALAPIEARLTRLKTELNEISQELERARLRLGDGVAAGRVGTVTI
jgi:AcrR family transcriptional regulator